MNAPSSAERVIVCSALRNSRLEIICGVRHYDQIMHGQIRNRNTWAPGKDVEQGFVDNKGVFVDRFEAWAVALAAKQIKEHSLKMCRAMPPRLYSEDLW